MTAILTALATANPARYATQQEICAFLESHFEMEPSERALYRELLLEGPIQGRYISVDEDEEICSQDPDRLIRRFAVHSRRIAAQAARTALDQARLKPADIEGLIVNTCTGYLCPGLSSYLLEDLGLPAHASVLDLMGMGCGGAIPNLEAACRMIQSGARKTVLCLSVEICSATFFLGRDPDLIVSNSIFSDGASAAILSANPRRASVPARQQRSCENAQPASAFPRGGTLKRGLGVDSRPECPCAERSDEAISTLVMGDCFASLAMTCPSQRRVPQASRLRIPSGTPATQLSPRPSALTMPPGGSLRFIDFESLTLPRYREQLRYTTLGGRLRNVLTRNVPVIGARAVAQVTRRLLDRHDLTLGDIDHWVVHPGGTQVLKAVERQIGLTPEMLRFSYEVFREYGNMSSPSVMFVLERTLREAKPQSGDRGLLLSFGAGFTAFAALVEFL